MQAVDRRTFLRTATAAAGLAGLVGGRRISRAFAQGTPVNLKFGNDLPATHSIYVRSLILQKYAGNIG